jgi:hypothetical protein
MGGWSREVNAGSFPKGKGWPVNGEFEKKILVDAREMPARCAVSLRGMPSYILKTAHGAMIVQSKSADYRAAIGVEVEGVRWPGRDVSCT